MTADGISMGACAELRRAAKRGTDYLELADRYDLGYATVVRHVRGECAHAIDEPAAPLE